MESPETVKATCTTTTTTTTATTTSDSHAIQDSPIFSYLSNLSPIKADRAAPVAPGFPGLNSPPIVFTSPHINPTRGQNCPKRLQYHPDYGGKRHPTGAYSQTEKMSNNKCTMHDQSSSLSGSVDQYLTDAVELECADSAHSDPSCLKQSDDTPQLLNDFSNPKESISRDDNKIDERKDSERVEEDPQGPSIQDTKTGDTESRQGGDGMPSSSSVCPKVEPSSSACHAYEEQHREPVIQVTSVKLQHADSGNGDEVYYKSQFQQESLQTVQQFEDCLDTTAEVSNGPINNVILVNPKASQHQRGTHRRCLQFEEAQQQNISGNRSGLLNPSNSVTSLNLPASPADSEVLESSRAATGQLINLNPPNSSVISPRNCGGSTFTVSKPLGIGLHLNSIISAVPLACGATTSMKSAGEGYLSIQGKKLVSVTGRQGFSNVVEKVCVRTEDCKLETQASVEASSANFLSPQFVKPLNILKPSKSQATPNDKRKSNSESSDTVEELNRSSPQKKRKKASSTTDDGCKRCNCKKTRCLKLYCDCFAAGIYCAGPCSCQGCYNRPEYEDTVLETREQIESRNPLAFAPKIEDGNRATPSSARHKRGCNCKKSMCLKKYCECYQANVGCSDGCRCEGCKNVYGRKEEFGMAKDVETKQPLNEKLEGAYDERLEMVATTIGLLHTELSHSHSLTPLTPSLECSDQGKNASKSRFPSRRFDPSPESGLALLPPYGRFPGSPINQEMDCNNASTFEKSLPKYDRYIVHSLGAMRDPNSMVMASSTSLETREWNDTSSAQFCPGNSHFSAGSSLRWRSSPISPMTQFGGAKFLEALESENELYNIFEDDTPEILKDTSAPVNAVKVSSPNKKRVSPPHSRLHELRSSSSVGMRSGRKFILQAVPSFPPLTPCVDSNDRANPTIDDPQDCSSNK